MIGTIYFAKKNSNFKWLTWRLSPCRLMRTIQYNTMYESPADWSKYIVFNYGCVYVFFSLETKWILSSLRFECMWESCFIAAYNKHLSLVLCDVMSHVLKAHTRIHWFPNPWFSFTLHFWCACVRVWKLLTHV